MLMAGPGYESSSQNPYEKIRLIVEQMRKQFIEFVQIAEEITALRKSPAYVLWPQEDTQEKMLLQRAHECERAIYASIKNIMRSEVPGANKVFAQQVVALQGLAVYTNSNEIRMMSIFLLLELAHVGATFDHSVPLKHLFGALQSHLEKISTSPWHKRGSRIDGALAILSQELENTGFKRESQFQLYIDIYKTTLEFHTYDYESYELPVHINKICMLLEQSITALADPAVSGSLLGLIQTLLHKGIEIKEDAAPWNRDPATLDRTFATYMQEIRNTQAQILQSQLASVVNALQSAQALSAGLSGLTTAKPAPSKAGSVDLIMEYSFTNYKSQPLVPSDPAQLKVATAISKIELR